MVRSIGDQGAAAQNIQKPGAEGLAGGEELACSSVPKTGMPNSISFRHCDFGMVI